MDTDSFTIHTKTKDLYKDQSINTIQNYATQIQIALPFILKLNKYLYKDFANDVEKKLIHQINRPLPKGKNKKVNGLIKDELGRTIMTEFVGYRPKTYSYLKAHSQVRDQFWQKMMQNAFYFASKALFVIQVFALTLWSCSKTA